MTRKEFIEKHKHKLAGFVVDAAVQQRSGGELALWLRGKMMEIDRDIGLMFDDLQPPQPPTQANGYAKQPARVN